MREIKFRAWDKISKTIYPVVRLWFENGVLQNVWIETSEGLIAKRSLNEIVLMQYTGLRDMYDKEICEGDVLRNPEHPEDGLAVVDFNPYGYWALRYTYYIGVEDYYPLDEYTTDDFCVHAYEIVGNIYETQKLYKNLESMEEENGN